MRPLIVVLGCLLASLTSFCQRIDSAAVKNLPPEQRAQVNYHLGKAKNAKTTALTLSIAGGALGIGGVA